MDGFKEDKPSPNGSLLPPVITRRKSFRSSITQNNAPLAPPFSAGSRAGSVTPPPSVTSSPEKIEAQAVAPAEEEKSGDMIWDPTSDEGVVEPDFQADTDAVFEELTQQAEALREEFPLEAFIVPEHSDRVPTGMEGKPLPQTPEPTALSSLAERLEKLSHRLRVEDTDAVVRRLASGDRLDTLLAGLLAGYLAGASEKP